MSTPYRLTQFLNANNPSGFATQQDLQLFALQIKDVVDTLSTLSILELKALFPHLMAQALAVDAHTAGIVILNYIEDANLETHSPFFAILVYQSGDMTNLQTTLKAEEIALTGKLDASATGFSSVNKKNLFVFKGDLAIPSDPSGLLKLDIEVPSDGEGTFDVYVFGVEI